MNYSSAETAAEGKRDTGVSVLSGLREWARSQRRRQERLLHPLRRRSALRRLRRLELPGSVLFVCHGNICRSPYAEAAFRQLLRGAWREAIHVASAGFIGPDRPAPPGAQAVAGRRGIDISGHRSVLVSEVAVRAADLVVVMEAKQSRTIRRRFGGVPHRQLVLGDLDPMPIDQRTIHDPVDQPLEVFEECYARIDRCLDALIEQLTASARPARVRDSSH